MVVGEGPHSARKPNAELGMIRIVFGRSLQGSERRRERFCDGLSYLELLIWLVIARERQPSFFTEAGRQDHARIQTSAQSHRGSTEPWQRSPFDCPPHSPCELICQIGFTNG